MSGEKPALSFYNMSRSVFIENLGILLKLIYETTKSTPQKCISLSDATIRI